jgi:hypothetical protein
VSNLVRNEKMKLWATYFNNMAVAIFVAGAVTPIFSVDQRIVDNKWWFWTAAVVMGSACRFIADWYIGKLKG